MKKAGLSFSDEALQIWEKNERQINSLIRKLLPFNTSASPEDYQQEAFIACCEAMQKWRDLRDKGTRQYRMNGQSVNLAVMRPEVFAFWFIQKRLNKAANSGEVQFDVVAPDGSYKRLTNQEYRRNKTMLERTGHAVRAVNVFIDLDPPGGSERRRREIEDREYWN